MENKQIRQSYGGMVKDLTKSKFPNKFYPDARNIKITATNSQSTYSVTNEKGNELILSIPTIKIFKKTKKTGTKEETTSRIEYSNKKLFYLNDEITSQYLESSNLTAESGIQKIIGSVSIKDNIILFTTDDNGFDCIWKVDDITFDLELLYIRNMNFSLNNPIEVINNYESKIIDKIYWINGKNQLMFLNIYNNIINGDYENLIDVPFSGIKKTGDYKVYQPKVVSISKGGSHTSGMIQYAYNLYRLNGSQTKLSPLSKLISLDKGNNLGGGEVNEVVGSIPNVFISNIDKNYTNIKIYAIKYTSYNQLPSISLINDSSVVGINKINYYDDGSIISSVSIDEFTFLGSDIIIPKNINSKNNIMFLANYKEKNFDIPNEDELNSIDLRAFSFQSNTTSTKIYNSLEKNSLGQIISTEPAIDINSTYISTGLPKINHRNSAININYDLYNKQFNSTVLGGEGPYLKYKIKRNSKQVLSQVVKEEKSNVLKDNEIYRIAIEFYNNYGQYSLPKWIADFKNIVIGNESNLNGYYASLEIELKPLFYTWLSNNNNFLDESGNYDESLKPVGYRILRAERNLSDRTILCQGIINGMMSQVTGDSSGGFVNDEPNAYTINLANSGVKLPSMMRRFDNSLTPMRGNKSYRRLDRHDSGKGYNEVFSSTSSSGWTSGTYQFNSLMNMFSPEVMFNISQEFSQSELYVIGGIENTSNEMYSEVRDIATKLKNSSVQIKNAISPYDPSVSLVSQFGPEGPLFFNRHGYFGPSNGELMQFNQVYREYNGNFKKSLSNIPYKIYGSPEIANLGQGRTIYNNDGKLVYYNSLEPLSTDTGSFSTNSDPNHGVSSVNSWGARNITFALDEEDKLPENRTKLETLYSLSSINEPKYALIGEFRIPKEVIYLGGIYGGNTYESKRRTNYIKTGDYKKIEESIYNNTDIGDTFVSDFKFTKLVKTETEVYKEESQQITEIVNFTVETTVDLKNRNDFSISNWDSRFQPRYEEYQKYNKVYSQQSNLLLSKDTDYRFKKVNEFSNNIISTKVKVPGEVIDSWTDLQVNNVMSLDGKHGPINSLHKFKDELYAFQDNALAYISIQPRVQVQGSDGISVELGTGTVLNEYKYLSTESGTLNKWSVVNSPSMFYYYDTLNNSINVFKGQIEGLSDSKGIHTWFINNISLEELKINNPLIKKGVSSGYDYINNDMFMTFHQNDKNPFTISFNEGIQQFISFHDYIPSMYISKGDNFITTHPDINKIYQQNGGEYNNFYGNTSKSTITLMINPEADMDTVFDNIMFKSEVYINDIDQPASTLTALRLYNEYQDSGIIPLVFGRDKNLRRKFRDWNAILPRNQGTRERIRNPWVYLTLEFDNTTNKKLVLHDIVVSYSV